MSLSMDMCLVPVLKDRVEVKVQDLRRNKLTFYCFFSEIYLSPSTQTSLCQLPTRLN